MGKVTPIKIIDRATGEMELGVEVSDLYTTVLVGRKEYFFNSDTGAFDGTGTFLGPLPDADGDEPVEEDKGDPYTYIARIRWKVGHPTVHEFMFLTPQEAKETTASLLERHGDLLELEGLFRQSARNVPETGHEPLAGASYQVSFGLSMPMGRAYNHETMRFDSYAEASKFVQALVQGGLINKDGMDFYETTFEPLT